MRNAWALHSSRSGSIAPITLITDSPTWFVLQKASCAALCSVHSELAACNTLANRLARPVQTPPRYLTLDSSVA